MRFKKSLISRVAEAVRLDPSIQATPKKLAEASGCDLEHLESLGIREADLKKLQLWGLAKCGYLRTRKGHQKRWVLISPTP